MSDLPFSAHKTKPWLEITQATAIFVYLSHFPTSHNPPLPLLTAMNHNSMDIPLFICVPINTASSSASVVSEADDHHSLNPIVLEALVHLEPSKRNRPKRSRWTCCDSHLHKQPPKVPQRQPRRRPSTSSHLSWADDVSLDVVSETGMDTLPSKDTAAPPQAPTRRASNSPKRPSFSDASPKMPRRSWVGLGEEYYEPLADLRWQDEAENISQSSNSFTSSSTGSRSRSSASDRSPSSPKTRSPSSPTRSPSTEKKRMGRSRPVPIRPRRSPSPSAVAA